MKFPLCLILTIPGLIFTVRQAIAQENPISQISYSTTFGPSHLIEGESTMVNALVDINDTTGIIQKLDFEVPLWTFNGINGAYLSWIGDGERFPNLSFKSKEFIKKKGKWRIKGHLDFRNRIVPMTLYVKLMDKEEYFLLKGGFSLRPKDHFDFSPDNNRVPSRIPMEFSFVFDK